MFAWRHPCYGDMWKISSCQRIYEWRYYKWHISRRFFKGIIRQWQWENSCWPFYCPHFIFINSQRQIRISFKSVPKYWCKLQNPCLVEQKIHFSGESKDVNDLIIKIQSQINGKILPFKSINCITDPNEVVYCPTEFLNSLDLPGLPPQNLQQTVGSVIIILRNLNHPKLCNGTRLSFKKLWKL